MDTPELYSGDQGAIGLEVADGLIGLHEGGMDNNRRSDSYFGIVYKKSLGKYEIFADGRMIPCALSSLMRKDLIYPTADANSVRRRVQKVKVNKHVDPLAIGDKVRIVDAKDGSGLIVERLPRRNQFSRRGSGPAEQYQQQAMAANIDLAALIFAAAQPDPRWNLLDRYLVTAEAAELPVVIILTKVDLISRNGKSLEDSLRIYRDIGYPFVQTCAMTGQGLSELKDTLRGKITILLGQSGVGKTTLLNALQPDLGLRTGQVSEATGKGRHTTSGLALFPLDIGGGVIDTPGVREFGIWDIDPSELDWFFPEMRPYLGDCKFGLDCTHDEEPGCAVRKAVMAGAIDPHRWQSYLRMRAEP